MAESTMIILYVIAGIVVPLLFPFISWALGRWYQGSIMSTLIENEKVVVNTYGFDNKASVTTSNKMAQIWNNLQLNNAKSIADVRASALEWYRTNFQN